MKYILTFTIAIFGLYFNTGIAAGSQLNESTNNSVEATEPAQLPQELLAKFNNELTKLKAKAESQKTPKGTEHMMRFYWQYKNAFEVMPANSQIDVLNIFATGDDHGSKLKGIQLIDKVVEYIVLIDGGFTKDNVRNLRKYDHFIRKFNESAKIILDIILDERLSALEEKGVRLKAEGVRLDEKLEKLIRLRKTMEKFIQ